MKITKKVQRQLLSIAMKHSCAVRERGDLEPRHSDSEDFLDVAVWSLKAALEDAYELGLKEGQHGKG